MNEFKVKKVEKKEYIQYTCRIEEEVLEAIKHIVLEYNLKSVNSFINDCLKFGLSNLKFEWGK